MKNFFSKDESSKSYSLVSIGLVLALPISFAGLVVVLLHQKKNYKIEAANLKRKSLLESSCNLLENIEGLLSKQEIESQITKSYRIEKDLLSLTPFLSQEIEERKNLIRNYREKLEQCRNSLFLGQKILTSANRTEIEKKDAIEEIRQSNELALVLISNLNWIEKNLMKSNATFSDSEDGENEDEAVPMANANLLIRRINIPPRINRGYDNRILLQQRVEQQNRPIFFFNNQRMINPIINRNRFLKRK